MTVGLRESQAPMTRDFAMVGGSHTRGFWTKRKRTAGSLLAVLGLVAGVAVAYKLFQQTVPNNVVRDASTFDYTLQAKDVDAGETAYRSTGSPTTPVFRQNLVTTPACAAENWPTTSEACNVNTYPGDTRRSDVLITNTNALPAKTASFTVHVDQATILVYAYDVDYNHNGIVDPGDIDLNGNSILDEYTLIPTSDSRWNRFVNFWTLSVDKQTYFTAPILTGSGEYENDPARDESYAPACTGGTLRSFTPAAQCKLGQIKGFGSDAVEVPPVVGDTLGEFPSRPNDDREYRFYMSEEDDGTDQSAFLGWRIQFDLVFQARLSPEAETGRTSTLPVGENI